jgi:SAM-dependent methyltransferase
MSDMRRQRLVDFVDWANDHITGDEKGESQTFLDHLFRAFGHRGVLDVGATYEERIKKRQGATAFADLVWKPHCLIEMKKRGTDLATAYQQAFDYWTRLVPGRPHYVVLCNFDEFWVYDFDTQVDEPVDKVPLAELPDRYGPFMWLFPTREEPIFGNHNEQVTRDAAALLGTLFRKLAGRQDVGREQAQLFVLQLLVALFAEDIGLLDQDTIPKLVRDADSPERAHDLFLDLFRAMNEPEPRTAGRFKGIRYFNGGLYAQPVSVELHPDELNLIFNPKDPDRAGAAGQNWSKVRPEVFGTIFEQTADQDERHAYGAHFTAGVDIHKILRPTLIDPWQAAIDQADTLKTLRGLHQRMQHYTVLDPACGSGNFLYLAYRELKRLERTLLDKMADVSKRQAGGQMHLSFVTARQFFGMDINPFAVELAKVTMMIARKLAIDELHMDEPALPLDNLDDNFRVCDALIVPTDSPWAPPPLHDPPEHRGHVPTLWPDADVIIGNPPFLGAKRLKPERGSPYVDTVRKLYPDVPGMADYCVYWFRRAHDHLPACTPDDPLRGRAGLVGTQNIRNNKSREGGLDHIVQHGGVILDAVDNQPWSGEANVHVSIVNWIKTDPSHPDPPLVPESKALRFKLDDKPNRPRRHRGEGPATKRYELGHRDVPHINAALSDQAMVSEAKALECVKDPQVCSSGVILGYKGYAVTLQKRADLISADERNAEVVKPWIIGRDLLTGDGRPTRALIDFAAKDQFEARSYEAPFALVQKDALPDVRAKVETAKGTGMEGARAEHLERWWQLWNVRHDLREKLEQVSRYIACSRVTKRPIFVFVHPSVIPDAQCQVWTLDDDYSYGVIQSGAHWAWFFAKCSKLKSDYRYTRRSVWDTFPWPQGPEFRGPADGQVEAVAAAGREVRRVRDEALRSIKGGLRAVYRTLELPGKNPLKDAHAQLDAAVLDAYGFGPPRDAGGSGDAGGGAWLGPLLELNLAVAGREDRGEPVVGPGVPSRYAGDPAGLVTDDCIHP